MAKDTIPEFDTVAGNNTDIAGVNIAENFPAANINNAIRQAMAAMKSYLANTDTIASATSIDLGAALGNFVSITGTTTITALGTVAAGTWKDVQFSGILTLTYNATSLILPTAANITTAAGDTARFVSLGSGNWQCLEYYRATGLPLVSPTVVVPPSVPVRQTCLSGPMTSAGLSLFGGSPGSTTVTASATLIVTAANGETAAGDVNVVGSIVNPAWTGLSNNGTTFLGLTIAADGTCTPVSTATYVLQPAGTPSVTNNAYTFNIQEMRMYVGNGTSAVQTNTVFIGEVTIAGSVVTAITWYQILGRFYTSTATLSISSSNTIVHNIGTIPLQVTIGLICTTADHGFAVGDVVMAILNASGGGSGPGMATWANRLTCGVSAGISIFSNTKTGGLATAITIASWGVYACLSRGW